MSQADKASLDDDAKELELELLKEQQRTKILNERLSRLKAVIPGSSSQGKEGRVTVDAEAGYLTEWVARSTVEALAKQIVKDAEGSFEDAESKRVLVTESLALIDGDWKRAIITVRLGQMRSELTARLEELKGLEGRLAATESAEGGQADGRDEAPRPTNPRASSRSQEGEGTSPVDSALVTATPDLTEAASGEPPAAGSIAAVLGSAGDILSMLRTDYRISGREVHLSSVSLAAEVVAQFRSARPKVTFSLETFSLFRESAILRDLDSLIRTRDELALSIPRVQGLTGDGGLISDLERRVVAARDARDELAAEAKPEERKKVADALLRAETELADKRSKESLEVRRARAVVESTLTQIAAIDLEVLALVAPLPDGSPPPIVAAGILERLRSGRAADRFTHVMYIGVDNSGGEIVTRRGLFQASGHVNYLGGVSSTWVLITTADSSVVASGTEAEATGLAYNLKRSGGTLTSIDKSIAINRLRRWRSALWRYLVRPIVGVVFVVFTIIVLLTLTAVVIGWIPALVEWLQTLVSQLTPSPR